jgi:hypothetical protein
MARICVNHQPKDIKGRKMKMTALHFDIMKDAIAAIDTAETRAQYFEQCTSLRAYQWYLVRKAGLLPFMCDELYKYLNDDHIQTALNRIVKGF